MTTSIAAQSESELKEVVAAMAVVIVASGAPFREELSL